MGRSRRSWIAVALLFLLLVLFVLLALVTVVPGVLPRSRLRLVSSPIFLDREGRVLLTELTQGGLRYPSPLADLPAFLPSLLVAAEDQGFFAHPGVDLRGILRALYQNLRAAQVVAGGSTITQQLSHQLFFGEKVGRKGFVQKGLESIGALYLELVWPKDKILEEYLGRVYFGRLAYGVEAAARQYFGKSSASLDLAEGSALLALIQLPSLSDPGENLDLIKQRQKYILDRGVTKGVIFDTEASLAYLEPLDFLVAAQPQQSRPKTACQSEYLRQQARALLSTAGKDNPDWGGWVVQTTLDEDLVLESERILRRNLSQIALETQALSAAALAVQPGTGEILSYTCNVSWSEKDSAVDLILASRQPGSAIKPVTYLAALQQGWTLAATLQDSRQTFYTRKNEPFVPEDYDQRERGEVTLRQALASSLNIPAVQLLNEVGLPAFFETARALGVESFQDEDRYDLAITLGGGEVSLLELTTLYATLANQGDYVEPFVIKKIQRGEEVLYQHRPKVREKVLGEKSRELTYLMSDVLLDNDARRFGFSEISPLVTSQKTAAKTGTTQDFRDSWALGYNAEIVVGVWLGKADDTPLLGLSGVKGAAPIWHDLMEMFFKEGYLGWFDQPEGVMKVGQELFLTGTQLTEAGNSQPEDPTSNLKITYPYQNQVFRINPSDDLAWYQRLIFKAQVPDEVQSVQWWLNDEWLGQSQVANKEAQFKWQPRQGTFQLKIVSSPGLTDVLSFEVRQD